MEVELTLDIDQYEKWELLKRKGWDEYAYKKHTCQQCLWV